MIGTNLFGIGKYIPEEPEEAARRIRETGFTSVEPMLMFFSAMPEQVRAMGLQRVRQGLGKQKNSIWTDEEAPRLMELYRSQGLQIISAQVFGYANGMIPDRQLARAMVRFGLENDLKYYVVSGKAADPAQAERWIPSLNILGDSLKENGMQLLYHNHEMELKSRQGVTALEHILNSCPGLGLELDVGWVQFAGADPVSWMERYRDRLFLLHLKDICPDACEQNKSRCYRAIGEGCIPLKQILQTAKRCPLPDQGLIIDQDDALTDIFEESARGIRNIKNLWEEQR